MVVMVVVVVAVVKCNCSCYFRPWPANTSAEPQAVLKQLPCLNSRLVLDSMTRKPFARLWALVVGVCHMFFGRILDFLTSGVLGIFPLLAFWLAVGFIIYIGLSRGGGLPPHPHPHLHHHKRRCDISLGTLLAAVTQLFFLCLFFFFVFSCYFYIGYPAHHHHHHHHERRIGIASASSWKERKEGRKGGWLLVVWCPGSYRMYFVLLYSTVLLLLYLFSVPTYRLPS